MEAVNLLPAYARPGRRWATVGSDIPARRVLVLGGATAGAVAIAMGAAFAYERSQVNDKRSQLNDATARLTAIQAEAAPIHAIEAQAQSELSAVTTISSSRIPWEGVLQDLSRVLPDQVYLTSMQVNTPTPAASLAAPVVSAGAAVAAPAVPTSATFTINGVATSHDRVALVLDRLQLMPWLTDIVLNGSTRASVSNGTSTSSGDQFEITAAFSNVAGAK